MLNTPENRFLSELPEPERQLARALLESRHETPGAVRSLIEEHLVELRSAQSSNEFLDLGLAGRIAAACQQLIDALGAEAPDSHRRIILSAILYFVRDEDAESDTSSILGLDDDLRVVQAAARAVGHPDLAPTLS